ncbi:MAG TPA: GGDEF domain-containing protein [Kofleriaceae bacterium]|nr:GGDEF domain-containing protein [Kofleriaceae bacterium]
MSEWDVDTSITHLADANENRGVTRRDRACLVVLSGPRVGAVFRLDRPTTVIGRSGTADVNIDDDGVSRAHIRIVREDDAVIAEDLGSRNGTFVNGTRLAERLTLADGDKIQLGRGTILKFTYHDALDDSYQQRMVESALRDPLTRLYNKRYFDDRLDAELRFARRHGTSLALLLIDVDHFKNVNDQRGHLAGDKVLAEIAATLTQAVRNEDVVARYGGEELVVLSRAIGDDGAHNLAERLRKTVESLRTKVEEEPPVRVTISVGVAVYPTIEVANTTQLTAAADRALYQAKDGGRNRVAIAAPAVEPTRP